MPRARILDPHRRSMVSSNPITTGSVAGRKEEINSTRSRLAAAWDDHAARLRMRWKVPKQGSRSRPRMRNAAETVRRPGVRMTPASSTKTFGQVGRVNRSAHPREDGEKACREGIAGGQRVRGVLHPMRRVDALNRNNPTALRQIESEI